MILRAALAVAMLWGVPALSQSTSAVRAQDAAAQLARASVALQEAEGARDRVQALTDTVQAFEQGLAAMRDGLRQASVRENQLRRELQTREAEIARLLGVLQSMGSRPSPVMMLHPQGPTGSARSGMILADVTPALNTKASALRRDLEEVKVLRQLQQSATDTLQLGLNGVQDARARLSQAIADRTDLPRRFTEDPVRTAILISSTETLEGFASGLSQITETTDTAPAQDIADRKGKLTLPVQGQLLHAAGQADAAGIVRPGIILATRPRALVTTPVAATIRYRGPLLDLGNVVILEPADGTLFVLAGLDLVYGDAGQVIPEGTAVGLMGGKDAEIGAIVSLSSDGTGSDRTETLYIEVREDNSPVDPQTWFRLNKDG